MLVKVKCAEKVYNLPEVHKEIYPFIVFKQFLNDILFWIRTEAKKKNTTVNSVNTQPACKHWLWNYAADKGKRLKGLLGAAPQLTHERDVADIS